MLVLVRAVRCVICESSLDLGESSLSSVDILFESWTGTGAYFLAGCGSTSELRLRNLHKKLLFSVSRNGRSVNA